MTTAWLRFERCHGSASSLKNAEQYCRDRLYLFDRHTSTTMTQFQSRKPRRDLNNREKPIKKDTTTERVASSVPSSQKDIKTPIKRSLPSNDYGDSSKRMKFDENTNDIDPKKDHLTVFVSNLDYNINEEELTALFPNFTIKNVNIIKNATGRSRGFGYVEFPSEVDVKKAIDLDRTLLKGRPTFISSCLRDKSQREGFKYSEEMELTKLFVKGVAYSATKEDLMKLFGEYGSVKDVRIVCHKNGNSKGIAYIEFDTKEATKKALLKLDQFEFMGHTVSVLCLSEMFPDYF